MQIDYGDLAGEGTKITIVPSEDPGVACCILIKNSVLNATLKMSANDVWALREALKRYED